ncbi:hypothetical protein BML2496_32750 [Providencia rettgeri]|nr:hypothetical protein CQA26_16165 [Providencia rettgeri]BBU97392.1 hypothetical protein BML2496_32750 [Providencia rettgeri]
MKIRNIDKLNKNDFIKLSSIHSSIGKGDNFDSWFEESVSSKKIPKILYLIYIINYLTLVFFMEAPLILSLIPLTIAYLIPVLMVLFIDSVNSKIPFLFYLSIKIKLLIH